MTPRLFVRACVCFLILVPPSLFVVGLASGTMENQDVNKPEQEPAQTMPTTPAPVSSEEVQECSPSDDVARHGGKDALRLFGPAPPGYKRVLYYEDKGGKTYGLVRDETKEIIRISDKDGGFYEIVRDKKPQ